MSADPVSLAVRARLQAVPDAPEDVRLNRARWRRSAGGPYATRLARLRWGLRLVRSEAWHRVRGFGPREDTDGFLARALTEREALTGYHLYRPGLADRCLFVGSDDRVCYRPERAHPAPNAKARMEGV